MFYGSYEKTLGEISAKEISQKKALNIKSQKLIYISFISKTPLIPFSNVEFPFVVVDILFAIHYIFLPIYYLYCF